MLTHLVVKERIHLQNDVGFELTSLLLLHPGMSLDFGQLDPPAMIM